MALASLEARPIVSVDVWDTLLRRRCHPDEVKLAAAKLALANHGRAMTSALATRDSIHRCRIQAELSIGEASLANGFDDEYGLVDVWIRTIESVVSPAHRHEARAIGEAIARAEWELERRVVVPDPSIGEFVRAIAADRPIYILSDFYVPTDTLIDLVRECHPTLRVAGGLTSYSAGFNKRSGRLYDRFHETIGIGPAEHTHVGDNAETDVARALGRGIDARYFDGGEADRRRAENTRRFRARESADVRPHVAALAAEIAAARPGDAIEDELARRLVLTFAAFIEFVVDRTSRSGVDVVHYFTREGEFFARLHDAFVSTVRGRSDVPRARVLEVSRIATFGPSIRSLDANELVRFWSMYRAHSVATLLTSLGLSPDEFREDARAFGLTLDEELHDPRSDVRFTRLLSSERFRSHAERELEASRERLVRYLEGHGISESVDRVFVVDIGWRGTIQDNLARTIPGPKWEGAYLGLFRFLNPQPANVSKCAFLFDDRTDGDSESAMSPQAPIEMLANSRHGSVVGYEIDGDRAYARRRSSPGESRIHAAFTAAFQDAVVELAPIVWRYFEERGLSADDVATVAFDDVASLLANPLRRFAEVFFELVHDETFGVGTTVHRAASFDGWALLLGEGSIVRRLRCSLEASGWPAGLAAVDPLASIAKSVVQSTDRASAATRTARRTLKLLARIRKELAASLRDGELDDALAAMRDAVVERRLVARRRNPGG